MNSNRIKLQPNNDGANDSIENVNDLTDEENNQITPIKSEKIISMYRKSVSIYTSNLSRSSLGIRDAVSLMDIDLEEDQDFELINRYSKEFIRKSKISLHNLVLILQSAFKRVKSCKDKDIVLCLGATGCGKSTMISSLVYGPDSLEKI